MFKIPVVKNCPITRASLGRITMPQWLIADIVGTLERERGQEWLILLHGQRSADGMEVVIESVTVPQDQKRHSVEVELGDGDRVDDVIGVLHSHHSMSARFSPTDDTKLNPRFDVSIVVSENLVDDESTWLGFSYQAEGGVKLPCGAKGRIEFALVPEEVEDWPVTHSFGYGVSKNTDLGDCAKISYSEEDCDKWHVNRFAACQQLPTETVQRAYAFGKGTDDLHKLLPPPVKNKVIYGGWRPPSLESKTLLLDDGGLSDDVWAGYDKCDNCQFYEPISELEKRGQALLCADCASFFLDSVEPIIAGSPWEDDVEWEGREVQLLVKEYGGLS